jgi:F0F1-type ATP synthase membrane subunit c/vacuolar-type H+-ATPase subunit K
VFANLAGVGSPLMMRLGELGRIAIGLAVVVAVLSLGVAYRRTMRKLVEEPDIAPNQRNRLRLPVWGDTLTMALTNFTLKTMLRSKQHRLLYALYLGIGFAFALACARRTLYGTGKLFVADVRGPLLVASLLLLCCAVLGMRVVMTIPIALRANWVFRITMLRDEERYLGAVRRAFVGLGLGPVLFVLGLVFAVLWPIHVVVLGLWAWILVEFALAGFAKIPFACSYLPGKANLHVRSGAFALVLVGITDVFVDVEKRAFVDWRTLLWMLAALLGLGWFLRWRGMRNRKPIAFEEVPAKDIHAMELYRDGKLAMD